MIENLVLGSGGTKGISLIGFYKYLYENNHLDNIKNILGCSVGSLVGTMISVGYSYKEMEGLLLGFDVSKMINKNNNLLDIFENLGFDDGEAFSRIIKIILKAKTGNSDITFKEHYEKYKIKLIILGCNLDEYENVYFNYKNYPDMEIWKALRISCCIPLVFKPFKFNGHYYVDGALNNPCPTDYFKNQEKTLSVILEKLQTDKIVDFKSYFYSLFFYGNRIKMKKKIKKKNSITIVLDKQFDENEFEIDLETKKKFIEVGYQKTKEYFEEK